MKSRRRFQDSNAGSFSIASSWQNPNGGSSRKSVKCQTAPEIFQFREMETQTGLYTNVVQDQVSEKYKTLSLLEHFCKMHRNRTESEWKSRIEDGLVTVDCEVTTDPASRLDVEYFIEYVDEKVNMGTQTAATMDATPVSDSAHSSAESKRNGDDETGKGSREDSKTVEGVSSSSATPAAIDLTDPKLNRFLRHAGSLVLKELTDNAQGNARDLFHMALSDPSYGGGGDGAAGGDESQSIVYWKTLSVDLERRKVVFPDWTKAKHFRGTVVKCTLTRNKERIYDVEYDGGSVLTGVREEYIRILGEALNGVGGSPDRRGGGGGGGHRGSSSNSNSSTSSSNAQNMAKRISMLQEGMRVHAKVTSKNGTVKYLPGRVVKVTRSRNSSSTSGGGGGGGGIFDVECEGAHIAVGLTGEDLALGLVVGQTVEARRPSAVSLQCTGVSWNATGNSLAAAYGRNDLLGWCNYPGAVCCWSIFSKHLNPEDPEHVLDHPSCVMCVEFHPVNPALVAAGSFNGEVIVWDLTKPEQPLAVSPISEYSHKEPVTKVSWVFAHLAGVSSSTSDSSDTDAWLLSSVGTDGRVLFWSLKNKLLFPVKGATLSKGVSSSRRQYPACHGASTASFATSGSGSGADSRTGRPKWMLIGQEGGSIVRSQMNRVLTGSALNKNTFKSLPPVEELYHSVKRRDDTFSHQSHVGAITALHCSPFHRNLFLTAGSDGTVKLFHLLETLPLMQWEPRPPPSGIVRVGGSNNSGGGAGDNNNHNNSGGGGGGGGGSGAFAAVTAASFSPIRPLVFACASGDGFVYLYDLGLSQLTPVVALECPLHPPTHSSTSSSSSGSGSGNHADTNVATGYQRKSSNSKSRGKGSAAGAAGVAGGGASGGASESPGRVSVTGLALNHKQRGLVAACDYLGRVHIWKLGWKLANMRADEQLVLDRIGNISSGSNNAENVDEL